MGKASYAGYSTVSVHKASKIPDGISTDTACAAYAQGLTALTMAEEAHRVERGDWALVFGASGGVGGQLCQILRAKAARTMAVVGSRAKVAVARDAGADIVLIDGEDDIVDAVKETTGGEGVQVVFDGVGKETFDRGLECVARKGSMICFGTASGPVPPVPITSVPFPSPPTSLRSISYNLQQTRIQKHQTGPSLCVQLRSHASRTRALHLALIRSFRPLSFPRTLDRAHP